MSNVSTVAHELGGYLNYGEHGLSPYWQLSKLITQVYDGGTSGLTIEIDDEEWDVSIGHQYGAIKPRATDRIQSDALIEIRITAHNHLEKLPLLIQPRYENMRHNETGDRIRSPFDHNSQPDEGVAVKIDNGVNIEPSQYPLLVPKLLEAVARDAGIGWNPAWFTTYLDTSSIYAYERYLRIQRAMGLKIVRGDGTFSRLARLLANEKDASGYYDWNNENTIGYQHKITLDSTASRALIPGHRFGKKLEHYHPEHVRKKNESDPLYHLKIEAKFQKNLHGSSVPWSEYKRLTHEMEETLINLLAWSRVPTRTGMPFISDDYLNANAETELDIGRYDDPTPEIEVRQNSVLIRTLTAISRNDVEVLKAMTDGGEQMHPRELSEKSDLSRSTIYRSLQRMEGLVTNKNASVDFASVKIRQEVEEIIQYTDDLLEGAAQATSRLLNMDPDTVRQQGSAFQQWMNKYAADFLEDSHEQVKLKIQATVARHKSHKSAPWIVDVLEEAEIAWIQSGRKMVKFEEVLIDVGAELAGARFPTVRSIRRHNATR